MADDTKNGTLRSNLTLGVNNARTGQGIIAESVVAVTAAANANSTYTMMRLPSDARIHNLSKVQWDDLASEGSPTLDIGIKGVDGNVADDPDALNDGLNVAAAAGSAGVIKDHKNAGKYLWELAGASSDFGGFVDITLKIVDAAANTGGDLSLTMVYSTE